MSNLHTSGGQTLPNGPGAAAILAAGIGSAAFGIITIAAELFEGLHSALKFVGPVGALSGKTTTAVIIWLVVWFILARRWETTDVEMRPINLAAFAMLGLSLLLTFPPVWGLFL